MLGDRRGRREGTELGRGPRILQLGRGGAGVPWDRGLPAAQAEARAASEVTPPSALPLSAHICMPVKGPAHPKTHLSVAGPLSLFPC